VEDAHGSISCDRNGCTIRHGFATDLVFDRSGNLYVTDTVFNTLRRVDVHGIINTLACHRGGNGLAIDRAGNLYVTDADHNSVYRIDLKGAITLVAGKG